MTTMQPITPLQRAEELANTLSHGAAFVASLFAVPWLITVTRHWHSTSAVVGASVFGATVVLMYLISTVYHALPQGKAKGVLRTLDHMCIYLLIAGTYTPFTLGVLQGAWGWSLLAAIWTLAIIGIGVKWKSGARNSRWSVVFYLTMGWLVMVAIVPLWMNMPAAGFFWLLAGGAAYSFGTVFYVRHTQPYSHFIWHLFVVAGTACHFVAVTHYAAG